MTIKEALDDIVTSGINLGAGDFVSLEALEVAASVLEKMQWIDDTMDADGMGFVVGTTIKRYLKRQPTVDVAPVVHAHWEEADLVELQGTTSETMRMPNAGLRCTACAHAFDKRLLWKDNYCPNCDAKMNGGTENAFD